MQIILTDRQTDRQTDRLSKVNTDCLKGILAICILLHHLYQYSGLFRGTILSVLLQAFGYLAVAEFLFLSGYGLSISYEKRCHDYIKHFFHKRIFPFYLIIVLTTFCYLLKMYLFNDMISWLLVIQSFLFGGTVIKGGWYLQVQLLLYVVWFCIYREQASGVLKLKILLGLEILYCIVLGVLGYSTTWYEGVFAFPIGVLWADHRKEASDLFDSYKNWMFYLVLIFIGFSVTFVLGHVHVLGVLQVVMKVLSAVFFVGLLTTLMYRIHINYPILRYLGTISLETYIMQFVFLFLFHWMWFNIESPYVYVLCVSIATVASSVMLNPIIQMVYRICGKGN